jgi:hypothetical protein
MRLDPERKDLRAVADMTEEAEEIQEAQGAGK